jgi:hypothetical protein
MTIRSAPFMTVSASHGAINATVVCRAGRVVITISRDGIPAVENIDVGFTLDGEIIGPGSTITSIDRRRRSDRYRKYTGKVVGDLNYEHDEVVLIMTSPNAVEWELIVRASSDGAAFRYRVPASPITQWIGPDATRIPLPVHGRTWLLDYQTWYETKRFGANIGELPAGDYGFPALVTTDDDVFVLYSESDIDGRSSGAHVRFDPSELPSFALVTADDAIDAQLGYTSPWRVAIVGTLGDVVRSNLVDELAPAMDPSQLVVTRPGRAAWSWWSSQYSGAYFDDQKRFTDYAAAQGWEHVLVDCGWDATWVPELVSYASRRGIQVHLWSSWSDLDGAEALGKLALWRSWGVAGIKVDFMESESQERYRWYDAIIAETARVGLMVNFHGSVIPRGWARTHPQVVSYEGIRGAEYYVFYGDPLTAAHNVIQPFTRNVVGSMDFTPVTFSAPERETSDGHELALGVVFESGITHFADDPREYESRPLANALLAEISPFWDEVRLLCGHPDREAVVARRSGDRWFVGCIATGPARTISFDTTTLLDGKIDAWIVADEPARGRALLETTVLAHSGTISIDIATNGGFAAVLTPTGSPLRRAAPREYIAPPLIEPAISTLDGDLAVLATAPAATVRAAPGWSAIPAGEGRWIVGPPEEATPGGVCVVTAELAGIDNTVVVSHARVFVPYEKLPVSLSSLPFLSTRNLVGPVERNQSNGGGDPHDGGPLTVAGTAYDQGLGVSESSSIRFHLGGQMVSLTGEVGADDEIPKGAARALVLVDDEIRAEFLLTAGLAAQQVVVDISGAQILELRTEPLDTADPAHVDWLALTVSP